MRGAAWMLDTITHHHKPTIERHRMGYAKVKVSSGLILQALGLSDVLYGVVDAGFDFRNPGVIELVVENADFPDNGVVASEAVIVAEKTVSHFEFI